MENEDVKVGMKVVPFQKTVLGCGSLEKSYHWRAAKENNQPYLYVRGKLYEGDKDNDTWELSNKKDEGADYFNACDFEPYVENTNNKIKDEKENGMKYKVGDKVIVRKDLEDDKQYGSDYTLTFLGTMNNYKGKQVTIANVFEGDYKIEEDTTYYWTDEMFEGLVSQVNSTPLYKGKIKYKVDNNKTTTVKSNKKIGIAKFNHEDEFDLKTGITIAYLRSQGVNEDKIWDIVDILQCGDAAYKRLKEKEAEMKTEKIKEPEYEVFNASHWKEFLSGKLAVNCRTEEDTNKFLAILDDMDITWCGKSSLILTSNEWNNYKENTCYSFDEEMGGVEYSEDRYYKDEKYKIVTYKD